MGIMNNLKNAVVEDLGMAPVPMDQDEDQKAKKPEPVKKPEATKIQDSTVEAEEAAKKPKRKFTNIDEVVDFLEEKGYKVERKDLGPKDESKPEPNKPETNKPESKPEPNKPEPKYVPAKDTTPKVYQDRHLGVRHVQDGSFYNELANSAYDFDRNFGYGKSELSPTVINWISSLYPDVPELAEDIVKNRLRDILTKNPSLITEVKKIAKETTEVTVPYAVSFVSKLDGTEYESEAEAKAAMAPYEKIGATMQTTYYTRYRRCFLDGTRGEIVNESEVINFAKHYDGDLNKLLYELWLSKDKVVAKSSDSSASSKTTSG